MPLAALLQIGAGAERWAGVRQHDDTNARGRLDLVEPLTELGHELARQRVAVVLGVERDRRDPGVDTESDDLTSGSDDLISTGIHRDATVLSRRLASGNEQPEELFGVGAVPGAPHRRQRAHDLPSVAGGGEPRIQHGDDAAVGRGADQTAACLRQQHRRAWQVDLTERRPAEQLTARRQQRIVGPGERDPVDHDERQGRPGDVDALEQPGRREQARLVVGREGADQRRLGQIALREDGVRHDRPHGGGGLVHRPPTREQGERAPSGGGDECGQLLVHGGAELSPTAGRGGAARSTGARSPGSRTDCRRRRRRFRRPAGRRVRPATSGMVALVRIATWSFHTPSCIVGPTSSGAISSRGHSGEPDTKFDVPVAGGEGGVELLDQPAGHRLGAQLALLGVLDLGVDRAQHLADPTEARPGLAEELTNLVGQRTSAGVGRRVVRSLRRAAPRARSPRR